MSWSWTWCHTFVILALGGRDRRIKSLRLWAQSAHEASLRDMRNGLLKIEDYDSHMALSDITCNPSSQEDEAGRTQIEASLGYLQTPRQHNL